MKALLCANCGDIRALQTEWVTCKCGHTSARWLDPLLGKAEFRPYSDDPVFVPFYKDRCFILGLNNRLLQPAIEGRLAMYEDFRFAHGEATDAPNHVFDKSRANCWAVIVKVGQTNDVSWAEDV